VNWKKCASKLLNLKKSETEHKQTEKKLRYQLHFDQALLDIIPVPVFHKDKHLIYTGCNKAYEYYLTLVGIN